MGERLRRLFSMLGGLFSRTGGNVPTDQPVPPKKTPFELIPPEYSEADFAADAAKSSSKSASAAAQPLAVQPAPLEASAAAQPVAVADAGRTESMPRRLYSAMMEFLDRPVRWTRDDEPAGQASRPPSTSSRSQLPPRSGDWTSAKEHAAQRAARQVASQPIFGGMLDERDPPSGPIAPASAAAKPAETPSFFAFERDDDTGAEGFKAFASEADLKRRIATGEDTSIGDVAPRTSRVAATAKPSTAKPAATATTPPPSESANREEHEQTELLRRTWNWMRGQTGKKSAPAVSAAAAAKTATTPEIDPVQILSQPKAHAEAEFRRAAETHGKGSTEANAARDRMVERSQRLSRELASPGEQHIWKMYDQHVAGLAAGEKPPSFEKFKSDWMNEPVRSFKDDKQRDQWKSFLEATGTTEPKSGFTPEKEADLKKTWGQMSMGPYPEMAKGPEIFEASKPVGSESTATRQPPGFLGRIAGSIRSQTPFVRAVKSFLTGSAAAGGVTGPVAPAGGGGGGPPPVNPPRGPTGGGGGGGGGILGGVAGMAIGFLAGIVPGVINATVSLAKLALPSMPRVGTKEQDTDFAIQAHKVAGFATLGMPGVGSGAFFDAALISITQHLKRFTDAIIESRRHLAELNGVYAQQFALVDFQKMRLDAQLANRTQGTFAFASNAKMDFDQSLQPIYELGARLANFAAGAAAVWGKGLAELVKMDGRFIVIEWLAKKVEEHLNAQRKQEAGIRVNWIQGMAAGDFMQGNRKKPIIPNGGLNNQVPFEPLPPLPVGPQRN